MMENIACDVNVDFFMFVLKRGPPLPIPLKLDS
jgi:hypothetical protein